MVEDSSSNQYYVVEFVNRYYDEADDETISSTLSAERADEYLTALAEGYEVTDRKGELKFLTVETEVPQNVPETMAEEGSSEVVDTSAEEAVE
ncbi:MAG: hypothetical protein IKM28_00560 [Lachnospiraceae bacterium]|nr:hypothetical protein [Lachnospiraceae bacterium]